MGQGSNSSTLRQYNERVVISAVRKAGVASKPDLARSIGLTLQSLTRIVDALEEKGLLEKSGRRSVGIGQPSNLYQIKADGLFSIGIKLGRQNIEFVLSDFAGQVIDKAFHRYKDPTPKQLIDSLSDGIEVMLAKLSHTQRERFVGVGIAMPWFLGNWAAQDEMAPDIAQQWVDIDFASELEQRLPYSIFFENDCSAAAAAELYFGQIKAANNFLYIYIDTFVGGGLVLNGNLERGVHSNAANLATLPVPPSKLDSQNNPLGWDTLVNRASIATLLKHLQFHQVNIDNIADLADIIDDNRALVHDWMQDCAEGIVFCIMSCVSFLDLEKVIIDSLLPPFLLIELTSMIKRRLAAMPTSNLFLPDIQKGSLGEDAIAIGGAILPLYSHFAPDRTVLLKGGVPDRLQEK